MSYFSRQKQLSGHDSKSSIGNVSSVQSASEAFQTAKQKQQGEREEDMDTYERRQARSGPTSSLPSQKQPTKSVCYPWSIKRLLLPPPSPLPFSSPSTQTFPSPSPFPRYGHSLPASAIFDGELVIFGGLVNETLRDDLYSINIKELSTVLLKTNGDVPSPRVGHASALVDSVLIVWGGNTKLDGHGAQDDGLYILNLNTWEWTHIVAQLAPAGRYGHSVAVISKKIYVFGGQAGGDFFNDLWAFDINTLRESVHCWECIKPNSNKGPTRRTGHVSVAFEDRIIVFGGTDSLYHYNDTWAFDTNTCIWSELSCIGFIPSPREGHSAALVDDVMYIFGGRGVDGNVLGDLAAFRITDRRWFMFQNMGPAPNGRSGHAMASFGTRVFVTGGETSVPSKTEDPDVMHILDTKHIKYPPLPSHLEASKTKPPQQPPANDDSSTPRSSAPKQISQPRQFQLNAHPPIPTSGEDESKEPIQLRQNGDSLCSVEVGVEARTEKSPYGMPKLSTDSPAGQKGKLGDSSVDIPTTRVEGSRDEDGLASTIMDLQQAYARLQIELSMYVPYKCCAQHRLYVLYRLSKEWTAMTLVNAVLMFNKLYEPIRHRASQFWNSNLWVESIYKVIDSTMDETRGRLVALLKEKSLKVLRPEVSALSDDEVTTFVYILQFLIDKEGQYARPLERILRDIVMDRGTLPSYLHISGVKRISKNPVGCGGFADVWIGEILEQRLALKVPRIVGQYQPMDKLQKEFCKEAMTWRQLRHPNILPFYGICLDEFSPRIAMVSPWMENGNLLDYLHRHNNPARMTIICGIAEGLAYLHGLKPQVVHGDLRAVNVLMSDSGTPLISDFGLSRIIDSQITNTATSFDGKGCVRWHAPELLDYDFGRPSGFTPQTDVYAFACVVLEVFTLRAPFQEMKNDGQVIKRKIFDKKPPPRPEEPAASLGLTDQLWSVLEECWNFDPNGHPDIATILHRLRELSPADQLSTPTQNHPAVLQPLDILVSDEIRLFRMV